MTHCYVVIYYVNIIIIIKVKEDLVHTFRENDRWVSIEVKEVYM
jgi:hypothetical protein